MPKVGESAPDFTLKDQDGKTVGLRDFRGQKNVVLYFYPKDNTPICTREACSFRDAYPAFEGVDAVVLGISGDDEASHRGFAERHKLPFRVLSDPDHAVAKLYDAMMGFGLMAGRVTYVIDRAGIVRHVTEARFSADKHVEEARAALELIASNEGAAGGPR